ncbi:MAG: thiamine-phosphate kinase [Desulfurococcaceae archaeon]|nr:thiamine-phosphate kinase [Sulfolobales archaeon]MDW8169778.1 thiamine-phosphate kinase [Desulfurococcaceae archaeon]
MLLSEEDVVLRIMKYLSKQGFGERLGPGDDARDIVPRSHKLIVSIDGYSIESAKLPWRDLSDVGWCSVTSAVSDIVSKGGFPHGVLVSIGIPRSWNLSDIDELYRGISEACSFYSCRLLGGDTNSSTEAWISVAALGFTSNAYPPSRSGALDGDSLIVIGTYGPQGVVAIDGFKISNELKWVVEATKRPRAIIDVATVISRWSRAIHASMDVSDGLSYTLYTISVSSGKCIELSDLPLYVEELKEYCSSNTECIIERVLNGGEEYGVAIAVDSRYSTKISREMEAMNIPFRVIGIVRNCNKPRVTYKGRPIKVRRWDQFYGWKDTEDTY